MYLYVIQTITVGTEEEQAYYNLLSNRFLLLRRTLTLIVTNLLTTLWSTIDKVITNDMDDRRTSHGIWIEGPMGTGKTSSLFYLLYKLQSRDIPALLIDASSDKAEFANYLRWFCERKFAVWS